MIGWMLVDQPVSALTVSAGPIVACVGRAKLRTREDPFGLMIVCVIVPSVGTPGVNFAIAVAIASAFPPSTRIATFFAGIPFASATFVLFSYPRSLVTLEIPAMAASTPSRIVED